MNQKLNLRHSLMVLWLSTFTAVGLDLVPGQGTKIPQATWGSQKNKNKNLCNKVNRSLTPTPSLSILLPQATFVSIPGITLRKTLNLEK